MSLVRKVLSCKSSITTINHISSIGTLISIRRPFRTAHTLVSITIQYTQTHTMGKSDDLLAASILVEMAKSSSQPKPPHSQPSLASTHTLDESSPPQTRSEASHIHLLHRSHSCSRSNALESSKICDCYERTTRRRYSIGHLTGPDYLQSTKILLRPHLIRL